MEEEKRLKILLSDMKHLLAISEDIITDSEDENILQRALYQQDLVDQMIGTVKELEEIISERNKK